MINPTFGSEFRRYRLRAKRTQGDVADALGVSFTYISKIEKDKAQPPRRDKIEKAARFLELTEGEETELLLLAEKVPADVQEWVLDQPDAVRLYRSIQKASPDEQAEILEQLIKSVEKRLRGKK
jgi:transcriptional regulator with XRE-family HTH domain